MLLQLTIEGRDSLRSEHDDRDLSPRIHPESWAFKQMRFTHFLLTEGTEAVMCF